MWGEVETFFVMQVYWKRHVASIIIENEKHEELASYWVPIFVVRTIFKVLKLFRQGVRW